MSEARKSSEDFISENMDDSELVQSDTDKCSFGSLKLLWKTGDIILSLIINRDILEQDFKAI